jgi:protein ImuB
VFLERLRARLGADAVTGLAVQADHRPERAWRGTEPGAGTAAEAPQGPRPLWLLAPPQRLELRGDKPCWHGPLELLAGPERIESGWWDDAEAARDYFVAAAPGRELLWIFREHQPPHAWFVHGVFG